MTENPLLPNDQLQALYARTKYAISLESKREQPPRRNATPGGSRAAFAAACTLQLAEGDQLLCAPGDPLLPALAPQQTPSTWPTFASKQPPLVLLGAAVAAGLRAAKSESLVLVSVATNTDQPEWAAALTWAQTARLPLVLACADPSGFSTPSAAPKSSKPDAFTWPNIRKQANLLQFPILTVDGEDAVAVYRCMQESVLRARAGAGPAILWATLPSPRELRAHRPSDQEPLGRLRRYLQSRRVPLRSAS